MWAKMTLFLVPVGFVFSSIPTSHAAAPLWMLLSASIAHPEILSYLAPAIVGLLLYCGCGLAWWFNRHRSAACAGMVFATVILTGIWIWYMTIAGLEYFPALAVHSFWYPLSLALAIKLRLFRAELRR